MEHFEFTETNIHSMNQINALAAVQVSLKCAVLRSRSRGRNRKKLLLFVV
jgi:hypothetical protein